MRVTLLRINNVKNGTTLCNTTLCVTIIGERGGTSRCASYFLFAHEERDATLRNISLLSWEEEAVCATSLSSLLKKGGCLRNISSLLRKGRLAAQSYTLGT